MLVWAPVASAHILIVPDRVAPGSFTLFTVICPDERSAPVTGLQLVVPPSLAVDSIEPASGFRAQIVRDQTRRAIGLRWSGGRVAPGQMVTLRFTALAPTAPGIVHLAAVQTFADGSTEVWHTAGIAVGARPAANGSTTAAWAAVAIAGLAAVVSLVALVVAVRVSRRPRPG